MAVRAPNREPDRGSHTKILSVTAFEKASAAAAGILAPAAIVYPPPTPPTPSAASRITSPRFTVPEKESPILEETFSSESRLEDVPTTTLSLKPGDEVRIEITG